MYHFPQPMINYSAAEPFATELGASLLPFRRLFPNRETLSTGGVPFLAPMYRSQSSRYPLYHGGDMRDSLVR